MLYQEENEIIMWALYVPEKNSTLWYNIMAAKCSQTCDNALIILKNESNFR